MKLRNATSAPELIWQGRIQIGDEPGVYGDAHYAGLATEFPVTLTQYGGSGTVDVDFDIKSEGAGSFGAPYLGHKVTVFALTQVPSSNPPVWQKTKIGEATITSDDTTVTAAVAQGVRYVGVRVEADVAVTPGLYDDFVLVRLSLRASTHYADFGYRA